MQGHLRYGCSGRPTDRHQLIAPRQHRKGDMPELAWKVLMDEQHLHSVCEPPAGRLYTT
ncbi:MAG: hypothetical protein ACK5FE_05345 [Cyanobacteriota bacterium]